MRSLAMIRRSRRRDERGTSLLEVSMVVGLLVTVGAIFFTGVTTMQRGVSRSADRSATLDAVRLAVEQIDREVRSGNLFYDPAAETTATCAPGAGMCLRIYTQSPRPNAAPTDPGNRCVQWRLVDQELQTRDWSPTWSIDGIVGSWRTVAEHIVNTATDPPFRLASGTTWRLLDVSIAANRRASSGSTVRVDVSVAGRNTLFYDQTNPQHQAICGNPPAA